MLRESRKILWSEAMVMVFWRRLLNGCGYPIICPLLSAKNNASTTISMSLKRNCNSLCFSEQKSGIINKNGFVSRKEIQVAKSATDG